MYNMVRVLARIMLELWSGNLAQLFFLKKETVRKKISVLFIVWK